MRVVLLPRGIVVVVVVMEISGCLNEMLIKRVRLFNHLSRPGFLSHSTRLSSRAHFTSVRATGIPSMKMKMQMKSRAILTNVQRVGGRIVQALNKHHHTLSFSSITPSLV
jgi:hypothetical protein